MVSEFFIGLKVGATLSGVFDNAFRSARSAMDDLRKSSLRLSDAQKDLAGNVERTRRAYAGLDLARLERQHRQLEATLGRLTRQHEAWQASLRRGRALNIAPGGALQSTLRIQQSRIEVMASIRLSASIRQVEQKLESQRRDQGKAERNLPPAGEPRSGGRGGQGGGSKSGNRSGGGNDAGDAPAKRPSSSSPSSSSRWRWPSIDLSLGKLRLPTRQELICAADLAQKAGSAVAKASGKAHAALSTGDGRKALEAIHAKLNPKLGGKLPSVDKILDGLKTAETVGQVVSKSGQLAGATLRSLDGVKWSDLKPGDAGKSLIGKADYAKRGGAVIADASGKLHAALSKGEGREALDFVHGRLDKALGGKLPSVDKILGGLKTAETVGQVVSKTGQLAGVTLRSLDGVKWSDLKPGNAGKSLTGAADYAKRGGAVVADASGRLRAALSKGEGREALDFLHGKLNAKLGGVLPSVDSLLGGLGQLEELGKTVSKAGGMAGKAMRAYSGASGNVFQKAMAAAGTLLAGDDSGGDPGAKAGGKDGKGKKRPAAKPAAKTPKTGGASKPQPKTRAKPVPKAESPAKPKAASKPAAKPSVKPGNALKEARGLPGKSKSLLSGLKLPKSGGGLLNTGLKALSKGGKGLKSLIGKADLLGVGMDLLSTSRSSLSPQAKAAAYGKTLGGTAGALAGGAAGAAIGTMLLPGVGTFVGRQVGSWLGQKGGEWLGEKIGNWAGKPGAAPKPVAVPKRAIPPKPVAVPKPAAPAKPVPKPAAKPAAQAQQAQQLRRIQQTANKAAAKPAGPAAVFNITFSPQITINGPASAGVKQQAQQAMQQSFAEFERMMKRYEADRQRRSYAARS